MTRTGKFEKKLTHRERKDKICKDLEKASITTGIVSDIAGSFAGIAPVAVAALGLNVISRVIQGGFDVSRESMDCSSIPFDEIKEILDINFKKIDRKLDKHTKAMGEVYTMAVNSLSVIQSTRLEMKQSFKDILETMRYSRIKPIVDKINHFINYLDTEKEILNNLKIDQYISKLEEPEYLKIFQETKTPTADSLSVNIYSIINGELAIPVEKDDITASSVLKMLYYGTQAYIEVMYFLIEKYTYLANYYYQKRNFEKYNTYFDSVINSFNTFKAYLVGTGRRNGLISAVINIYRNKKVKKLLQLEEYNLVSHKKSLLRLLNDIKNKILFVIEEKPENTLRISFKLNIPPHGNWKNGTNVRYAVQYQRYNIYSKISVWTEPFQLNGKANPTLEGLPSAKRGTMRLIFRQIDDQKPQLVGNISWQCTLFDDFNRDIYNAADNIHKNIAYEETNKLFELLGEKININEKFDDGKQAIHAAAKRDNTDLALDFMLRTNKTNINSQDDMGYAPLHFAVETQSESFREMLLTEGADVNLETKLGLTPLHIAAKKGYVSSLKKLLAQNKINLNKKDSIGYTPLHYAVTNIVENVDLLVSENNTRVNEKSNLNLTPFHIAVMNTYDHHFNETLTVLLKSGRININEGNDNNETALHFACYEGNLRKIQFLLNLPGIDVNSQILDSKWSPLHLSIFLRSEPIVNELLETESIDINLRDNKNITPLNAAIGIGNLDLVRKLLRKGAITNTVSNEGFNIFHTAALRQEGEIIAALPLTYDHVNAKTNEGLTPLHLAVSRNNLEPARFLLLWHANIEARSNEGLTPIHLAVTSGYLESVQFLVDNNANIGAKTNKGLTPLQLSILEENLDILQYLLKHMVTIRSKSDDVSTALEFAVSSGKIESTEIILNFKGGINEKTKEGLTLLHTAASKGHLNIFKLLIERFADVKLTDKKGDLYFYYAVRNGHLNIIKYVIDQGIINITDIEQNKVNLNKHQPIIYWAMCDAINYGNLEVVKYFVGELGYKICNPIYTAASSGHLDIVKYLVEVQFMDINSSYDDNYDFNIPFLAAIINGYLEIVQYLISKGAEINKDYFYFNSVLEAAVRYDHVDILDYLIKKGAKTDIIIVHQKETLLHVAADWSFDCLKYLVDNNLVELNEQNERGYTALHNIVDNDKDWSPTAASYLCSKGADVTIKDTINRTAYDIAKLKRKESSYSCLNPNERFKRKENRLFHKKLLLRNNSFSNNSITENKLRNGLHLKYHFPQGNMYKKFEPKFSSLLSVENARESRIRGRSFEQNLNINSTLLLIDFFLKAISGQKYEFVKNGPLSELEAQARAIDITEEFKEDLKSLNDPTLEEQIDLSKVHSDLFKAIKKENERSIPNIFNSHIKSIYNFDINKNK